MSNKDMADKISLWSKDNLSSYLIEITSKIIVHPDDITREGYLLDFVSLSKTYFIFDSKTNINIIQIQDKGNISTNNDDCSNIVKEAVDSNISAPFVASALGVGYLSYNKKTVSKLLHHMHLGIFRFVQENR